MVKEATIDLDRARRDLEEEGSRLTHIRASLAQESALTDADRDATSEIAGADQHPADMGTEMFERERAVSILQRVDDQLADVRRALRRIDGGAYGTCEACGRPIAAARLEARPSARFCLDDQSRFEREARAS
ncbi:MAG: TraR/DksA C4-type zinc finger protein [Actinomycetota bacterium]